MVKISRILHAGYVFEHEDTQIAFDTIFESPFSRNCYAFPSVQFDLEQVRELKFDAVFISHYHDDHCSFDSLNLLDRSTPIYMFCVFPEMFDWIRELGFTHVYPLALNKPVQIGGFEITPRRALDADVDSLFQIKVSGLNILNVVDSWIDYDVLSLLENEKPWDLIMWPFQTMRELEVIAPTSFPASPKTLPPEWMEQLKQLSPRSVIPSSCQFKQEPWSWYNHAFYPVTYAQFAREVCEILPKTEIVRLDPGISIQISQNQIKPAEPLPWVLPQGEHGQDYEYKPDLKPPLTSDIAKHFGELSPQQRKSVEKFCSTDILAKFSSMELPEDSFFESAKIWQLSLYDHHGIDTTYIYEINNGDISLLGNYAGRVDWLTEVPIQKVYSSLETGESLTSMYVRITVEGADIMEDPLLRCLFTGEFGSYQLGQFKKLMGHLPVSKHLPPDSTSNAPDKKI